VLYYEKKLKKKGFKVIIGIDEAGRGPLAGPVVAAAVVLKRVRFKSRIDDSKKLSPRQREEAYLEIVRNANFGIGIINERIIDRVNILMATRMAMQKAVSSLLETIKSPKDTIHLIVDGNMILNFGLPCKAIVKGDGKSLSIAAASILAKVKRDRIMLKYDRIYPEYNFARHKGYPTLAHRTILAKLGPSPIHRKSFSYV